MPRNRNNLQYIPTRIEIGNPSSSNVFKVIDLSFHDVSSYKERIIAIRAEFPGHNRLRARARTSTSAFLHLRYHVDKETLLFIHVKTRDVYVDAFHVNDERPVKFGVGGAEYFGYDGSYTQIARGGLLGLPVGYHCFTKALKEIAVGCKSQPKKWKYKAKVGNTLAIVVVMIAEVARFKWVLDDLLLCFMNAEVCQGTLKDYHQEIILNWSDISVRAATMDPNHNLSSVDRARTMADFHKAMSDPNWANDCLAIHQF